jgi:hypothetical protein
LFEVGLVGDMGKQMKEGRKEGRKEEEERLRNQHPKRKIAICLMNTNTHDIKMI